MTVMKASDQPSKKAPAVPAMGNLRTVLSMDRAGAPPRPPGDGGDTGPSTLSDLA